MTRVGWALYLKDKRQCKKLLHWYTCSELKRIEHLFIGRDQLLGKRYDFLRCHSGFFRRSWTYLSPLETRGVVVEDRECSPHFERTRTDSDRQHLWQLFGFGIICGLTWNLLVISYPVNFRHWITLHLADHMNRFVPFRDGRFWLFDYSRPWNLVKSYFYEYRPLTSPSAEGSRPESGTRTSGRSGTMNDGVLKAIFDDVVFVKGAVVVWAVIIDFWNNNE